MNIWGSAHFLDDIHDKPMIQALPPGLPDWLIIIHFQSTTVPQLVASPVRATDRMSR